MAGNNLANLATVPADALTALRKATAPLVRPLGCEAIQLFGGRTESQQTTGAAGTTQEFAYELMARHDKAAHNPRVILSASRATTSPNPISCTAALSFVSALSDLDGAWTGASATFSDGLASGARVGATASASRAQHVYSDVAAAYPVSRSDGGTRPLLAGRCFTGSLSTNMAILGKAGVDLTNWDSRTAGKARFREHNTSGDQRTAATWGASSIKVSRSMVTGFVFTHDGPVCNVMSLSDSTLAGEGSGITYQYESQVLLACELINAASPRAWMVHSNQGWSGQTTPLVVQRLKDILAYGLVPDILVFRAGSLNDMGAVGNPVTETIVNGWRAAMHEILALCAANGICPIVMPILPVDHSVRQIGTSDSLRRNFNTNEVRTLAAQGILVADDEVLVAGAIDGNGQGTFSIGSSTDLVHLNDVGKTLTLPPIQANILAAVGGYI